MRIKGEVLRIKFRMMGENSGRNNRQLFSIMGSSLATEHGYITNVN